MCTKSRGFRNYQYLSDTSPTLVTTTVSQLYILCPETPLQSLFYIPSPNMKKVQQSISFRKSVFAAGYKEG